MVRCEVRNQVNTESKVLVVGLGMAGVCTANLLQRGKHQVTAVDAFPAPGLHHHSVSLPDESLSFDLPLRAISPHYYPNLFHVYKSMGVGLQSVNYQSTGCNASDKAPRFRYSNIIIGGHAFPLPVLLPFSRLRTIVQVVASYLWYVFHTPYLLRFHATWLADTTTRDFFAYYNYSDDFVFGFFLPVMSTLLSCSYAQVMDYPADLLAMFFCARSTTCVTGWYKVKDGVAAVSNRLLKDIPCRFNTRIQRVTRTINPQTGRPQCHVVFPDGSLEVYDHVIFACDVGAVEKMLADPDEDERVLLTHCSAAFTARIVAHRDNRLIQPDRSSWNTLNYFSDDDPQAVRRMGDLQPAPRSTHENARCASMTTAYLGHIGKPAADVFQTWNPYQEIDENSIIKESWMTRGVWNVNGRHVFESLGTKVQGRNAIWFAGATMCIGVTLLEQACTSALDVAEDFGVDVGFTPARDPAGGRLYNIVIAFATLLHVTYVALRRPLSVVSNLVYPHVKSTQSKC